MISTMFNIPLEIISIPFSHWIEWDSEKLDGSYPSDWIGSNPDFGRYFISEKCIHVILPLLLV